MEPVDVDAIEAKTAETRVQVGLHIGNFHSGPIHRIDPRMSAFGGNNQSLPAFPSTEPSAKKFLATMASTGEPFGVDFGRVQHIASGLEVGFNNAFGGRIVNA